MLWRRISEKVGLSPPPRCESFWNQSAGMERGDEMPDFGTAGDSGWTVTTTMGGSRGALIARSGAFRGRDGGSAALIVVLCVARAMPSEK